MNILGHVVAGVVGVFVLVFGAVLTVAALAIPAILIGVVLYASVSVLIGA